MSQDQRQQRVRLLVKKLNKARRRQASQIDILCHDLIVAQRDFVRRLDDVSFAAAFYKSLIGESDLRRLLTAAGRVLQDALPGASLRFFLRQPQQCRFRVPDSRDDLLIEGHPLEDHFTSELVDGICKSKQLCRLQDLYEMGLEGGPEAFSHLSVAALPLNDLGRPLGFILVCRSMSCPLSGAELRRIGLITCGLSHAIAGCRLPLHCSA